MTPGSCLARIEAGLTGSDLAVAQVDLQRAMAGEALPGEEQAVGSAQRGFSLDRGDDDLRALAIEASGFRCETEGHVPAIRKGAGAALPVTMRALTQCRVIGPAGIAERGQPLLEREARG